MRIRYHSSARNEVIKAAKYYEDQANGVGNRFLAEIDRVVLDIADLPILWPITEYGTRKRILVSPFPFSIHYKIVHDEIVIIAVAHQSRQEDYWMSRLD
ncbi:hypothetical protein BH10ACI2_BH10ACI2_08870 [soil metagenome]